MQLKRIIIVFNLSQEGNGIDFNLPICSHFQREEKFSLVANSAKELKRYVDR